MMKNLLSFALILLIYFPGSAQTKTNLPGSDKRKAAMGVMVSMADNRVRIDSVIPGLTFEKLGIRKNDVLISFNGTNITSLNDFYTAAGTMRANNEISVGIERNKKASVKKGKAIVKPYEESAFADITYDWVPYKQGALRVMAKKPKNKTVCPTILFIPGYNCSSIENFQNNYNGKLINEWLKAGYGVVCIEKSGTGDSYGCKPCVEADMQTDIETFGLGYEYMQKLSWADKNNLFIWGHSMGGVIGPVLAEKYHPKGIMAFATVYRPWNEFLLEMHRIQYPLDGKSYAETETFVRGMQKVYNELFVNKKSPEQIAQIPELKKLAESELEYKPGNTNMWGRHWKFWQQIDSLNLAQSWSNTDGKVLSIFGGADYIACSELEHNLIVETVNATHPGNATYLRIEDIDHIMSINHSFKESSDHISNKKYQDEHFNYAISKKTIEWMDAVCKEQK